MKIERLLCMMCFRKPGFPCSRILFLAERVMEYPTSMKNSGAEKRLIMSARAYRFEVWASFMRKRGACCVSISIMAKPLRASMARILSTGAPSIPNNFFQLFISLKLIYYLVQMAEEVLWKGGRSPLSLLRYWVVGVITIPLLLLGFVVILLGLKKMFYTRYYVTTERIKTTQGLFSRVERDADLDKITDTLVKQNFWGRIFNYGDLYFSTAGSQGYEIVFYSVSNPNGIKNRIREVRKGFGGSKKSESDVSGSRSPVV